MSFKTAIRKLYAPQYLVKPELVRGELPDTKSAYSEFIKVAAPAVIELVLISLVSIADTAMVSVLGPNAITAVGLTAQPVMLLLFVFVALNIGVTAVVARRRGEERQEDANRVLRTCMPIVFVGAIVLAALGIIFAEFFVKLAGAKPEVVADSAAYFAIVAASLPFRAVSMCICAAHRGVGYTKIAMQINLVANGVNIVLNYLLIGGNFGFPKLGVAGAAIATSIGLTVGFVLALLSLCKSSNYLHFSRHASWKPDKDALKAVGKVGGNALLEQLVLRVGFFVFARIVANLSVNEFATHQICMQALNLSYNFADGLGVGATSLVGQNMGRDRHDLSVVYGKIAQRIALCVSLVLSVVFIIFRRQLVGLFLTGAEGGDLETILSLGSQIMIIAGCFIPLQTSQVVMGGSLRGAGDTKYVAGTMLVTVGMMRPFFGWLFVIVLNWGLPSAWAAMCLDMTVRLILLSRRFSSGKWFKIKV